MTAFGLRTFVVAVAAAALLLAAPAAAVPKRLQALRRTRTRTTACAHPIGDFVFFDATNKAGALGDESQYTNEFMPFIMCQFPTAQNLDFVRLYGKTACPTFDWADAEGEAAKWLKQIDSNGSKYGAISVSRTLYSALAVLFSKDKALDLWQGLHVPSNFPDRWREKQKAADRHMFALNNFVVQHLVQHAGVDVAAGAGKVLTVSVEDQVKTATDALKTYGDSKIQSKDPHHRNLIANTIAFECASAQAGHIYLGRAIDKPGFDSGWRIDDTNGDSKPNSLSFCGSLMAGFIGDSSACTYELSQTAKVTYAVSISIADYMAQANARVRAFFIPAIPTLMALYAKGEMWHPRSKFCSPDSYESTVGGVATNRPSMVNAKKLTALRVPCNDDTIGFAVSIHTHLFGAGGPTILAAATTATINVQDYSTAIKQAMEKFVTRWTKMKKEVYLVPVSTGEGSTAESSKDVDMHVKQVKTSTVAKEEKTPTLSTVVVHSKKEVDTTENSTEKKNTTEKKPSVSVSLTSTKVVQQKVVQQHVPVVDTSSVSSVRDFWRKKEEELQKKQTTTTDKKTTI